MTIQKEIFKDTLIEALGIEIAQVTDEQVIAKMPVNNVTRQPYGLLHGGASVALAETVASMATYNLIDSDTQYAVGIEINANHIRAKREGVVTAIGKPLHKGRTTMVWDIRIEDENENLICISRCTVGIFSKQR